MKILHLIDFFDARYERDQIKLIEYLEKKGYHNTVIASDVSSDWKKVGKKEFATWEKRFKETEILHEPTFRIPNPFSKGFLPIYLPSQKILHDFDIIHAYTFGTYSSILGAILKRTKKSGLVIRSDLSPTSYHKTTKKSLYRVMVMYPFYVADAVYVYSKIEKQFLNSLNISHNKIFVIPPGIDFGKFSKIQILPRRNHLTIGYLGRFCFVKGVHRLIPVLSKLLQEENKVKIVFTGIIENVEYAIEVLKTLGKFKKFQYIGSLSTSPINFFSICDVILIPSLTETGAITVLEAMASGKVVIASNINPINTYIQHEYDGFLFNSELEAYAYIKKLLQNPDLIREIGKNARKKAEHYDWQFIITKYEEMYRKVLSGL